MRIGILGIRIYCLVLSFLGFPAALLYSQPIEPGYIANVQHFSVAEGLSHRNVFCTFQDSRSFIWTGTQSGLNRFDGHEFKALNKQDGLTKNKAHKIVEDAEGWLWVVNQQSLFRFEKIKALSFVNIYTLEVKSLADKFGDDFPLPLSQITSIISSPQGTIYMGTKIGQLIRYHPDHGFSTYPVSGVHKIELTEYSEEQHLMGVYQIPANNKRFYLEIDSIGKIISTESRKRYIAHDHQGRKWFHQRKQFNPKDHRVEVFTLSGQQKSNVHPLNDFIPKEKKFNRIFLNISLRETDQNFWVSDDRRFFVFHPEKGLLYDFAKEYPEIINHHINQFYFDNRENIWTSTANGLYKIQLHKSPFKKHLSTSQGKEIRTGHSSSIRGMSVHDKQLWVNRELASPYIIDLNTGVPTLKDDLFILSKTNKLVSHLPIHSILNKQDTEVYLGASRALLIYNWEDQSYQVKYWKDQSNGIRIWSLFKDRDAQLWCGLESDGLGIWEQQTDSLSLYHGNHAGSLSNATVYTFLELDEQHFLFGGTSGIYMMHTQEGIKARFWQGGEGVFHFPFGTIHHLHRDSEDEGIIWVATEDEGLVKWHFPKIDTAEPTHKAEWQQFTKDQGLSSNNIYAVYEDNNSHLWLPSEYGLISFHKETQQADAFLEGDGISHNEFNRIAHYQDTMGRFYFGGLNGLTVFHPDSILKQTKAFNPPLEVLTYQLYNGTRQQLEDRTKELLANSTISLASDDRFFQLEFALLDYQDANRVRYAYRIEGHMDEWVSIKENYIRVSGLPYGNYRLQIKGQGADGVFSAHELVFPIRVLKPFYLNTWFFVFVSFTGLCFLFFLYQWRTRNFKKRQKELEERIYNATETIRQKNKQLQDLDQLKSRFFANVSHELKTPVTLILGPLSSMLKSGTLTEKNTTLADISQKNAVSLLNLVNEILDLTKMEFGKIELSEEPVELHSLLRLLTGAFEGIAQQKNINYHFYFQAPLDLQLNLDVKKISKLLNNLFLNAFKFTPSGGQIIVTLTDQGETIQLCVKDTGRGIHPSDLPHIFDRYYQSSRTDQAREGGTGIGLSMCMEFAKLMGGVLWVESTWGQGSSFYFKFPKKEAPVITTSFEVANPEATNFEDATKKTEAQTTEVSNFANSTILLVEDNENLRSYIQLIIGAKYKVITAENGKIAWDLLNEPPTDSFHLLPDLILSDIMMPEMDGYQLLEKIKENDAYRGIPVIMLTALSDIKDKLKALRIGVDDYMTKPFEEAELLARINNLLLHAHWRKAFQQSLQEEEGGSPPSLPKDTPLATTLSKTEMEWLTNLEKTILDKINRFDLSVEQLAYDMAFSRWQLNRRIKQLTGLTAINYLQEVRLIHARSLLENKECSSIKALTYKVGMRDIRYFSRQFKKRFGKIPSDYLA